MLVVSECVTHTYSSVCQVGRYGTVVSVVAGQTGRAGNQVGALHVMSLRAAVTLR